MSDPTEKVPATPPASEPTTTLRSDAETPKAPKESRRGSLARDILSGTWLVSILAVVIALVLGAILIALADPRVQETAGYIFARPGDFFGAVWDKVSAAYSALFRGAIFDWQANSAVRSIRPLTESLVFATPLILAGLAVAIPFRAGMFNIGGQGQVVLGALTAGWIGYSLSLPPVVHLLVALLGGMVGGALYASIAGFLKARTGANEVIVTIMLNNIAAYLILYLLKQNWFTGTGSPLPQSPPVASTASLPLLLNPPFRLHFGFIIAILATVFVWWLMERSTVGFEFRAAGANPRAARSAGISVNKVIVLVMVVAGAFAGLAGANQVLGTEAKLTTGIAGSLGFDAITVALLGRSRPLGTFLSGLLFGALKAGGYVMQSQTGTPIDIVLVVQSIIVLLVAAPPLVRAIFRLPAPGAKPRKTTLKAKEVAA